jgi:acyl-CoA synthetase (AMP-forming)/AMP-acid ligase II
MTDAPESLIRRLSLHASTRGESVAFRFRRGLNGAPRDITWRALREAALRGAGALLSRRLGGARIGILCPDAHDFVVALASAMMAGATAVPLPGTLGRRSAPRVAAILKASGAAALIAPDDILASDWLPDGIVAGLEHVPTTALAAGDPAPEPRPADPTDPLLIQFTSGSTGEPSGVLLSHANVAANCHAIATAYGLDHRSIGLSWLPLHHDMGLVGHVLTPIHVGGLSVLMDPLRFLQKPLRWLEAIGEERATITSAPNFAYELCGRAMPSPQSRIDLGTLTTAICGGEPVMPETLERFAAAFAPHGFRADAFAPSYGLAEATLLVSSGKRRGGPRSIEGSAGSLSGGRRRMVLGPPAAGMRVRVVAADGSRCPDGAIGEIEIAGTSVGRRLGESPGEWLATGDLGMLSEGELVVAGRVRDLLILRGENIFPGDAEAAVTEASPAIVAGGAAAVGVEAEGTQAMVIVAEMRAEALTSPIDALMQLIRRRVAGATGHVPQDIVAVKPGSLPRTTSGKLRRAEIAALYQGGRLNRIVWPVAEQVPHA